MDYVLSTDNLVKSYGQARALSGLSMHVPKGAIYGIVGRNGAGKTTLIRLICGLQRPTSGTYSIYGREFTSRDIRLSRRRMGAVVETPSIYLDMSARENLRQQYRVLGLPSFEGIDELLALVGLADTGKKKARNFSLGMKQRLGIAQAVINDPAVLVLDEPTAGLDPKERVRFRNLIASFAQDKVVILSTHIVSDVECVADDILVMRDGAFLMQGTPADVVAQAAGKVWECHVDAQSADKLAAGNCVSNVHYAADGHAVVRMVADEPPTAGARPLEPTLEDVYLYVFRDEARDDAPSWRM